MAKKKKVSAKDQVDLVHLFVYVPEISPVVDPNQKIPVLIFVDPDVEPDVKYQDHPHDQPPCLNLCEATQSTDIAGFNYIAWIAVNKLIPGNEYTLHVHAHKDGFASSYQRCKIRIEKPDYAVTNPPTIAYPSAGGQVGTSFTAVGYDNPPTTQVSGWVVDGIGNSYPGATLAVPPAPYNWGVSFSGLPTGTCTLCIQITGTPRKTSETIVIS